MKISLLLSLLASAVAVSAHGYITHITVNGANGQRFPGNNPSSGNKDPKRIVWDYRNNGPVFSKTLDGPNIACSLDSKPVDSFGEAKPGDTLTFHWSQWSESHRGPTMTYIARLPDGVDMKTVNPTSLTWYKIHHMGLLSSKGGNGKGTWASDEMRKASFSMTVKIPDTVPNGKYVFRHEFLALHQAQRGDAQFYPVCANFILSGAKEGAKLEGQSATFPGTYKADHAGVKINIHNGAVKNGYSIPGPPPIAGAAASKRAVRGIDWRNE